jgi:colicin import membrane protein
MKPPVLILLLAAMAASAQPATRSEVAAQRAAVEQRFEREKAECEQRFSVSSCLDDVRQRRRDALAPLVKREHELAAEERRARAAAQAQRVHDREVTASQDEGQRRERAVLAPAPAAPASRAPRTPRALNPEAAEQARRQAVQEAEAEAAKRREQAQERQQRQRQLVAEHEAKEKKRTKPVAAPLPLPGASAASKAN